MCTVVDREAFSKSRETAWKVSPQKV
jgi:hypothetical protein